MGSGRAGRDALRGCGGAWRVSIYPESGGKRPNSRSRKGIGESLPGASGAHHIIPSYEKANMWANKLEAEGYACHLFPNASYNGVYVERALHWGLHITDYWKWAARTLEHAIGLNMACPSHHEARYWLGRIKSAIESGNFPGSK